MRRPVLAAILALGAMTGAEAQVTLGVARTPGITFHVPPPEPPPVLVPPQTPPQPAAPDGENDLFLASPETYAPPDARRRGRHRRRAPYEPWPPYGRPFVVPMDTAGPAAPAAHPIFVVQLPPVAPLVLPPDDRERPEATIREHHGPAIDVTPARVPTIFVIPRCYAGDRMPISSQLPAGCDLDALRIFYHPPS